jgi:hypothetical protein
MKVGDRVSRGLDTPYYSCEFVAIEANYVGRVR